MKRSSFIPSLEDIISYSNGDVVDKFLETYHLPPDEAEDVFKEMLKWLWLGSAAKEDGFDKLVVHEDLFILDEMWHTFILFTRDYTDFCERYFGYYLHHTPSTKTIREVEEAASKADPEAYLKKVEDELREHYGYVYDRLGEETLLKWYKVYPEKYGRNSVKTIQK